MKYFLLLISLSFVSKVSFAGSDLSHFKNRFEIKINQENEKIIVDKSLVEDLSMDVYIKNLATYLTAEDAAPSEIIPTCKGFEYEKPNPELMKSFNKSFEWMKKTNLGQLLVDEKFLKFINAVELETQKYVKDPQFVIAANLDNSTFFYKKAFIKYLKGKLEDIAKSYFNATIYLKVVTYIADDYSNFIVHKKLYHQNILSYYLETFPPEELGLTEAEKRRALSSILDSRLSFGFGGYWESKKIKNNFAEYGHNKLQTADVNAEKRWLKHSQIFDERLYKFNHSFSEVSYGASPLTINLAVKKDKSDDRPSYVFDDECPDFLYKQRRAYELTRIALGMSPIPYSNKLFGIVKSKYQSQALDEAMYYGYLESTNQNEKKEFVLKQSMNPLLK